MMGTIVLKGHSGCRLELIQSSEHQIVRKISKDASYNARLKKQAEKQRDFFHPKFCTPKIFGEGFQGELYYFDMEYIHGQSLVELIETFSVAEIKGVVQQFIDLSNMEFTTYNQGVSIFDAKIRELAIFEGGSPDYFKTALTYLSQHPPKVHFTSRCHGDLTFENIIVSNGRYYLIDFLDSFYDSWLIDMAKLLQDVECFWSFREQKKISENLHLRLMLFRNELLLALMSLTHGHEIVDSTHRFLLLNLLRICPYAVSSATKEWLGKAIPQVLDMIESRQTKGDS
jgi:hypothetical protein